MSTQPPTTITVHTDQGPLALPAGSHLADAVAALLARSDARLPGTPDTTPTPATAVATAVNGQFVARHARAAHALQDGDTVLCFSPITGG